MADTIYVGTGHGLFVCQRVGDRYEVTGAGLEESHVTSAVAREGVILAGTTNGVYRSDDYGRTWRGASEGLGVRRVRWMAFHPDVSDFEFAGTEPADIFISHDGAETWRECPEVARLRDEHRWSLPYSPEAGCVRGFAFHGSRAFAGVEVGGVLRSDDAGETWRLAEGSSGDPEMENPPEPLIYPDVHSIVAAPTDAAAPAILFAPTGAGLYRSSDGGAQWASLYECYCRSVWVDPWDGNHLVLGPADAVEWNGRIEETRDGGKHWSPASRGLEVPWSDYMVERFAQIDDELFAVLSNGQLLCTPVKTLEWKRILDKLEGMTCITAMQS
ncbi:MAG: hypothetical protein M1132_07715 [Chloroflexi bacterium]|nr:hypothetical protein [Chloroflexota bacterium]